MMPLTRLLCFLSQQTIVLIVITLASVWHHLFYFPTNTPTIYKCRTLHQILQILRNIIVIPNNLLCCLCSPVAERQNSDAASLLSPITYIQYIDLIIDSVIVLENDVPKYELF